jgi:hypothetical protein
MYEKYVISSNQVYLYGIILAFIIGIVAYLYSRKEKQNQKSSLIISLKALIISAVVLILTGLQCRKEITTTDYNAMVYDKTIKYASVINFQNFDDSSTIQNLQKFVNGNKPDFVKDSLKHKCKLITSMYLSLMDDMISYVDLSSSDTIFSVGSKTKSFYERYTIGVRETELADSILMPIINEVNNTRSEVYARLRIAKGFAEIEQLNNMQASIKENQLKIREYYYNIFKEEIK